jgi:hypothetical protein
LVAAEASRSTSRHPSRWGAGSPSSRHDPRPSAVGLEPSHCREALHARGAGAPRGVDLDRVAQREGHALLDDGHLTDDAVTLAVREREEDHDLEAVPGAPRGARPR